MRDCLFVCEEVGETFHRDAESLCQNVVSRSRSFLSSLYNQMIDIIGNGLAEIRISLQPRGWIGHFLEIIKLVMPDRNVRSFVFTLKNRCKLEFDRVTRTISYRSFRTDG